MKLRGLLLVVAAVVATVAISASQGAISATTPLVAFARGVLGLTGVQRELRTARSMPFDPQAGLRLREDFSRRFGAHGAILAQELGRGRSRSQLVAMGALGPRDGLRFKYAT